MRLVTMSTALALSFAASALGTPAFAVGAKKQPVAKQQRVASVVPVKKAAVAKHKRVAPVTPVRATGASVMKTVTAKRQSVASVASAPIVAYDRHDLLASAEYGQQPQQNAHRARTETAASTGVARTPRLFAFGDPVSEARRWIGTNPTDRNSLWCARFMNFVLERSGFKGTGSDAASSFAAYGQRVPGPQVGAIAVMTRGKNGGHVGIVSGFDGSGNPIIISGNHGHRVGEGVYPRGRIYAYVMPR